MLLNKKDKPTSGLKKTLTFKDLLMLCLAASIGAGIMTQVGIVIHEYTGIGIVLSYLLAGIGCMLVALPYCELASMIPCSGGIYSYTYIAFGQFLAWIMFCTIFAEMIASCAIVSIGWVEYTNELLLAYNIEYITYYTQNMYIQIIPTIVILISAYMISRGINTYKLINNILVYSKFVVLGLFVFCSIEDISSANISLHSDQGWQGIITAVPIIYFSFTGFTALATAAEEAKNPSRDLTLAIITSLTITTALYMIVSFVLASTTHYTFLDTTAPLSYSLRTRGYIFISRIVSIGAALSMISVIFACLYAGSRLLYRVAQDSLISRKLGEINQEQIPVRAIVMTAFGSIIMVHVISFDGLIAIASFTVIVSYIFACILVLFFRIYHPKRHRPFVSPLIWPISIIAMIYLSYFLIYFLLDPYHWSIFYKFCIYILFYYFAVSCKNKACL